jgi:sugar transferase (PEP-CTERM/EpsH1 system associated)
MANILFLSHRIPYPPNKGDKIRSWNLLKRLAENHNVHAGFFIDDSKDIEHIEFLSTVLDTLCPVVVRPFWQKLFSLRGLLLGKSLTECAYPYRRLRQYAKTLLQQQKVDCVVLFSAATAPIIFPVEDVPVLSDLVDVDSQKWAAYSVGESWLLSWLYRREAQLLEAFEAEVVKSSSKSVFVSDDEAGVFATLRPELAEKVLGIANGVDTNHFDPLRFKEQSEQAGLIFTGAMDYLPNIEAVEWFCNLVWPRLREKHPSLTFTIAGAPVSSRVARLGEQDGVQVTGFVDDMALELHKAAIAIAPLQIARGIQNKVLEAMAMRKPVVATSLANEGINASDGSQIQLADDPQAFLLAIEALLGDKELACKLGQNAREFVQKQYSWEQKYSEFERLIQDVV